MARPEKTAAVAEIVDSFNGSAGAVLTEYRGLTVAQLKTLRRSLGENAEYAVVLLPYMWMPAPRAPRGGTTKAPRRCPGLDHVRPSTREHGGSG